MLGTDAESRPSHLFSSQISPCLLGQVPCLTSLVALSCAPSSLNPRLDAGSTCSFTSVEQRETVNFLNFLNVYLIPQPRRLLALPAAKVPCSPSATPGPFGRAAPQLASSSPAEGDFPFRCKILALILDDFYNVPVNPLPRLSCSLRTAALSANI